MSNLNDKLFQLSKDFHEDDIDYICIIHRKKSTRTISYSYEIGDNASKLELAGYMDVAKHAILYGDKEDDE